MSQTLGMRGNIFHVAKVSGSTGAEQGLQTEPHRGSVWLQQERYLVGLNHAGGLLGARGREWRPGPTYLVVKGSREMWYPGKFISKYDV